MRLAFPVVACVLAAMGLVALTATTVDCAGCPGAPCPQSQFAITADECIASVTTNCRGSWAESCDAGSTGGFAGVTAPEDGGTCNVSATLASGTTIALEVHWVLRTPANRCCEASYEAVPPELAIGASDAGTD